MESSWKQNILQEVVIINFTRFSLLLLLFCNVINTLVMLCTASGVFTVLLSHHYILAVFQQLKITCLLTELFCLSRLGLNLAL